jgi:hypothetical protein
MSTGSTFNYFDDNVSVEWIINPDQPIKLWQQYQFAYDRLDQYLQDTSQFIPLDSIGHKSVMLSAYYMYTYQTFNIDQFRFTYCLRHIVDSWIENDIMLVEYMLGANQMGLYAMIQTLMSEDK